VQREPHQLLRAFQLALAGGMAVIMTILSLTVTSLGFLSCRDFKTSNTANPYFFDLIAQGTEHM